MIGDIIRFCLIGLQIAGNYLCCFYLYLRVNMSSKQIVRHVMVSYMWGLAMACMTRLNPSPVQFIIIVLLELGYMYITVYCYAEGSFLQNIFRIYFPAQVANVVAYTTFLICNPRFLENYLAYDTGFLKESSIEILLYALASMGTLVFLQSFLLRIFQKIEHLDWFYKLLFIFLQVTSLQEACIRFFTPLKTANGKHVIFRFLFSMFLVVMVIYAIIRSRRIEMKREYKKLNEMTQNVQKQYEEILAEHEEYHKLNHEWNRQIAVVKDLQQRVSREELSRYTERLDKKTSYIMKAIRSGNLYLDIALDKQRETLVKFGIPVDMVIEPVYMEKGVMRDVIAITEEMFQYTCRCIKDIRWYRFDLRKKHGKLICYMEIGYPGGYTYYIQKFRNRIGNEMEVRQHLCMTRHIADMRDGMIRYTLGQNSMELAVMISLENEILQGDKTI